MMYDVYGFPTATYDISGKAVSPRADYSNYTITELGRASWDFWNQACAYSKGTIFQLNNNNCITVNIDSFRNLTSSSFVLQNGGHGNSAMFSRRYYHPTDMYPLLYVCAFTGTGNPNVCVYRVTNTNATIVQNLNLSNAPVCYWGSPCIDTDNPNIMYVYGYTINDALTDVDGTNFMRINTFDLSNLTDNGDGTFTPTLISTQTLDYWIYVIQGCTFYDGYIWVSSGGTSTQQYIYAIDPSDGEIRYTVNIGNTIETEGIAWVTDDEDSPWLLISQQHLSYLKCKFA